MFWNRKNQPAPGDTDQEQNASIGINPTGNTMLSAVLGGLIGIVAMAPVAYILHKNTPPQIVTVDIQRLVDDQQKAFIEMLTKGPVTDEQREIAVKMSADFAKKLSVTVDKLGKDCNCVIVNKAALLSGSYIDYTDVVRERMK